MWSLKSCFEILMRHFTSRFTSDKNCRVTAVVLINSSLDDMISSRSKSSSRFYFNVSILKTRKIGLLETSAYNYPMRWSHFLAKPNTQKCLCKNVTGCPCRVLQLIYTLISKHLFTM